MILYLLLFVGIAVALESNLSFSGTEASFPSSSTKLGPSALDPLASSLGRSVAAGATTSRTEFSTEMDITLLPQVPTDIVFHSSVNVEYIYPASSVSAAGTSSDMSSVSGMSVSRPTVVASLQRTTARARTQNGDTTSSQLQQSVQTSQVESPSRGSSSYETTGRSLSRSSASSALSSYSRTSEGSETSRKTSSAAGTSVTGSAALYSTQDSSTTSIEKPKSSTITPSRPQRVYSGITLPSSNVWPPSLSSTPTVPFTVLSPSIRLTQVITTDNKNGIHYVTSTQVTMVVVTSTPPVVVVGAGVTDASTSQENPSSISLATTSTQLGASPQLNKISSASVSRISPMALVLSLIALVLSYCL